MKLRLILGLVIFWMLYSCQAVKETEPPKVIEERGIVTKSDGYEDVVVSVIGNPSYFLVGKPYTLVIDHDYVPSVDPTISDGFGFYIIREGIIIDYLKPSGNNRNSPTTFRYTFQSAGSYTLRLVLYPITKIPPFVIRDYYYQASTVCPVCGNNPGTCPTNSVRPNIDGPRNFDYVNNITKDYYPRFTHCTIHPEDLEWVVSSATPEGTESGIITRLIDGTGAVRVKFNQSGMYYLDAYHPDIASFTQRKHIFAAQKMTN